jgi:integrase
MTGAWSLRVSTGLPTGRTDLQKQFRHCFELRATDVSHSDLRHSYATRGLEAGVSPKVVQERLGHVRIGATLDISSMPTPFRPRVGLTRCLERSLLQAVPGTNGQFQGCKLTGR